MFKNTILASLLLVFTLNSYSQNYVSTYAGTGSAGLQNGAVSQAKFSSPFGMCIDKNSTIYVADNGNNCIRKITADGTVSTYAGSRTAGYVDGTLTQARFRAPTGVCVDDSGNVYVSDFENHRIRKITADGIVSTLAGNGVAGLADGVGTQAQFSFPRGICRDAAGNLYVGDSWNHRIRKITPQGMVSTYAGGGDTIGVQSVGHYKDAADTSARFYTPCEVKIDAQNNIYVADAYTHRIRKIDANRMVSTLAGSGDIGQQAGGFANGSAETALFKVPTTIFIAADGSFYVGDGANQRVRKIKDGIVSTFAGSGATGFSDAIDSLATFNFPRAVVEDVQKSTFYVVDFNNHSLRQIAAQTSGIQNNTISNDVTIFPNPASNIVYINSPSAANKWAAIYDLSGKEMVYYAPHAFEQTLQLSTTHIPTGVYIVKVGQQQQILTQKIIICK